MTPLGPDVGRNDPCPCGSGKKYKRCCGFRQEAVSLDAARFHRLDGRLVDRLFEFAAAVVTAAGRKRSWSRFRVAPRFGVEPDREAHFYRKWVLYDWRPEARDLRKSSRLRGGVPPARAFLERHGDELPPEERRILELQLAAPFSFYEVREVEPGRRLRLRDVLRDDGTILEVEERAASRTLGGGDVLFARLVPWGPRHVIAATGEIPIPPRERPMLVQLRNRMRGSFGDTDDVWLHLAQDATRGAYLALRRRLLAPEIPEIRNTDGDRCEDHVLRYRIGDPHAAALGLADLDVSARDAGVDPLETARRDRSGRVAAVELSWTRLGYEDSPGPENTILGRIEIRGRRMTVEVNSAKRAATIRGEIERRLGDAARLESVETRDVREELVRRQRERPPSPDPPAPVGADWPPEVVAVLRESARKELEVWPDREVPLLGGRTPRQAVADRDGRELVDALLLEMERGQMGELGVDFAPIRRELGL